VRQQKEAQLSTPSLTTTPVTLSSTALSHIPPPPSHSTHTDVGSSDQVITHSSNGRFGLIDIGHGKQEGNTTVCRQQKVYCVDIPTVHETSFRSLDIVTLFRS
jgi:hypothetical protein